MAKQTFSTGQVLTSAQMTSLQANDYNWTVSAKTASYVLAAADAGTRITMNAAGATTITVNTALFAAGDILDIVNIGAGTCTVTAGTATVTTSGTLALSQWQSGALFFTSASAAIFFPSGAKEKILQVVSTAKTDTFTSTSTTFIDITGLSVTITPQSATNKVLVFAQVTGSEDVGTGPGYIQLVRGSTAIDIGDAAGTRVRASAALSTPYATEPGIFGLVFLDSPATTSATTYKIQGRQATAGTFFINRSDTDSDSVLFMRGASTITVMEISA